jgi:hypothetical protein
MVMKVIAEETIRRNVWGTEPNQIDWQSRALF